MPSLFDPTALRRRLVIAVALVAALGALAVSPTHRSIVTPAFAQAPADRAAPQQPDAAKAPAPADAAPPAAKPDDADEPDEAEPDAPAAKPGKRHHGVGVGITIDGNDHVRIHQGRSSDDFDSFEAMLDKAPWIAGVIFLSTAMLFLVPLLVIILVIWYKMRKARMLNETMLKLAERGVVPPAEAMDAIGAARPQAAMASGPHTASLYERARGIRARSVWSDLRRGVILMAIGLAVQMCSMVEDGEASGIGLVLLFLGVAYVVLWYFEDRQAPVSTPAGGQAPPAPPMDGGGTGTP
jgi:Domain of unknown function (DUF6249)